MLAGEDDAVSEAGPLGERAGQRRHLDRLGSRADDVKTRGTRRRAGGLAAPRSTSCPTVFDHSAPPPARQGRMFGPQRRACYIGARQKEERTMRAMAAGALALLLTGTACAAAAPLHRLSDRDFAHYAASKFDQRAMMGRRLVLGSHGGTRVVADFVCGDVCPAYTKRIIHYDVPPERCGAVHGKVVSQLVPRGPAVIGQPLCEPPVLAGRQR